MEEGGSAKRFRKRSIEPSERRICKKQNIDTQIFTDPLALADRFLDLRSVSWYSLEKREHAVQAEFPLVIDQTELFPQTVHVTLRKQTDHVLFSRRDCERDRMQQRDGLVICQFVDINIASASLPSVDAFRATDHSSPPLCPLEKQNNNSRYVCRLAIPIFSPDLDDPTCRYSCLRLASIHHAGRCCDHFVRDETWSRLYGTYFSYCRYTSSFSQFEIIICC